jgi:hypothetical protein
VNSVPPQRDDLGPRRGQRISHQRLEADQVRASQARVSSAVTKRRLPSATPWWVPRAAGCCRTDVRHFKGQIIEYGVIADPARLSRLNLAVLAEGSR